MKPGESPKICEIRKIAGNKNNFQYIISSCQFFNPKPSLNVTFHSLVSRAAAALLLTLPFSIANAVPVTFAFTAEIKSMSLYDSSTGISTTTGITLLPGEGSGIGDWYTGTFSYDTAAPVHPGIESLPGIDMWYEDFSAGHGTYFNNRDKTVNYSSANAPSWNGTALALTKSSLFIAPARDDKPDNSKSAYFYLSAWNEEPFPDVRPPAYLDLGQFEYTSFSLSLHVAPNRFLDLRGAIIGLSAVGVPGLSSVDETGGNGSAVPEPAQLLLFALAGLAAGVVGWRRMPR